MKQIVLFGGSCGKCKRIEKMLYQIIDELNIQIHFKKTEDLKLMAAHDVLYLPSIMIDERVCFKGVIPRKKELKDALMDRTE